MRSASRSYSAYAASIGFHHAGSNSGTHCAVSRTSAKRVGIAIRSISLVSCEQPTMKAPANATSIAAMARTPVRMGASNPRIRKA